MRRIILQLFNTGLQYLPAPRFRKSIFFYHHLRMWLQQASIIPAVYRMVHHMIFRAVLQSPKALKTNAAFGPTYQRRVEKFRGLHCTGFRNKSYLL